MSWRSRSRPLINPLSRLAKPVQPQVRLGWASDVMRGRAVLSPQQAKAAPMYCCRCMYNTFLLLRRNLAGLAEHKVELSWAARFDSCSTSYRSSKDNGGMTESSARVEAGESSSPARFCIGDLSDSISQHTAFGPSSPVSISIRTTLGVALTDRLGELEHPLCGRHSGGLHVYHDAWMRGTPPLIRARGCNSFWIRLAMRRSFAPHVCDLRDEHHAALAASELEAPASLLDVVTPYQLDLQRHMLYVMESTSLVSIWLRMIILDV